MKNFADKKANQSVPKDFAANNSQGHLSRTAPRPYTEALTSIAEPKFIPKYNGTVFRHPKRADDDIIIKFEGPGVMILRKVRLMRLINSALFIIGN